MANTLSIIPYQYVATFVGSIILIVYGMLFGWTTPSLPQLLDPNSRIKMTTSDGSWMAVMPCIGGPIGNLIAAYLVDRIGRKKSILLISPLYLFSWIMIAYANYKYIFHAARILGGIADGIAFTVFPIYVGEIADSKVRGLLSSSEGVTIVLGFLIIAILGSIFTIHEAALISCTLPIVHFVFFAFMPESPYYLLMKNQPIEATQSMIKLRGYQDVSEEIDRLSRSIEEDSKIKGNSLDLFRVKSNRRAFYIILIIRTLQQFSGPMVITFYATIIFDEAGTNLAPSTCTSIYFSVQLIAAIICSCLMNKFGKKPLLIVSVIGSCLSLATQGTYFYLKDVQLVDLESYRWLSIAALLTYNFFFTFGMGTIPAAILGEFFPISIKAVALCCADLYFNIAVILATKFFQIIDNNMGMAIPFFVFSSCCALALIYIIQWFPETKGKTLEEIQDYFKGANKITSNTNVE